MLALSDACTEAILHDEHLVLGRRLQTFCFDHWHILEALGSPIIRGGTVTRIDLQLAVQACATASTEEFYTASRKPSWQWSFWRRVTRSEKLFPLAQELAAFREYIRDYLPQFETWEIEDTSEPKFPGLWLAAAALIAAGHSRHEVRRETGLGELICWSYAIAERNGGKLDSLMSDAEVAAAREIEAEEAARHG